MSSIPTPAADRWSCNIAGKLMCAVCGVWNPMLRPVDRMTCRSCGAKETLSPEQWRLLLAPASTRARVWEKATSGVAHNADYAAPDGPLGERLDLCILRSDPPCPSCLEPVKEADFEAKRCSRCKTALQAEVPPPWLLEAVPRLVLIVPDPSVGELPVGNVEGRRQASREGAVVACPQCHSSLELRVGVGAIVKCSRCDASVVVPDDIRAALSVDPWLTGEQVHSGHWWALLRVNADEERTLAAATADAVAKAAAVAASLGWKEARSVEELLALEPPEDDEDDDDYDEDDDDDDDDEDDSETGGKGSWVLLGGCGLVLGLLLVVGVGIVLAVLFAGIAVGALF